MLSLKSLARRMAHQRTVGLVVVLVTVLALAHQWLADPAQDTTSQSWTGSLSWSDGAFKHFWSVETLDGKGAVDAMHRRPAPGASIHRSDEKDEDDPEFEGSSSAKSYHHIAGGRPKQSDRHTKVFSSEPPAEPRPITKLIRHAPGWTIYENLYVSDGTMYIITPDASVWPEVRMMASTALEAVNTPENGRMREPTDDVMQFISPEAAEQLWGDRVYEVSDWTFMINDPGQFLSHYYHFVAETFFGLWRMYASMDSKIKADGTTTLPPLARIVFPHCNENQWRDYSTFNQWFLHGVFPSLSIETSEHWQARKSMTISSSRRKAFRYSNLVLADRSASFRGPLCPGVTNRIASEAYEPTKDISSKWWWEPVRRGVLRFAGTDSEVINRSVMWDGVWTGDTDYPADAKTMQLAAKRMPVVVSYIVRMGNRRALVKEDHEGLVEALTTLCDSRGWELNVVHAEKLAREEQIQLAAKTTVMLGIHGNGLTHLVWMPTTPLSTVIEIFVQDGFARDYEWTARALGMRHFAVWNDTWHTAPNTAHVHYPDGFQGAEIRAHGPSIAKLIEDRIDGKI